MPEMLEGVYPFECYTIQPLPHERFETKSQQLWMDGARDLWIKDYLYTKETHAWIHFESISSMICHDPNNFLSLIGSKITEAGLGIEYIRSMIAYHDNYLDDLPVMKKEIALPNVEVAVSSAKNKILQGVKPFMTFRIEDIIGYDLYISDGDLWVKDDHHQEMHNTRWVEFLDLYDIYTISKDNVEFIANTRKMLTENFLVGDKYNSMMLAYYDYHKVRVAYIGQRLKPEFIKELERLDMTIPDELLEEFIDKYKPEVCDTLERGDLLQFIGKKVTGMDWPCNGDDQSSKIEFFRILHKNSKSFGIEIINTK